MIFVGEGALLRRAVTHAAGLGHPVDLVCSADPLDAVAAGAPTSRRRTSTPTPAR